MRATAMGGPGPSDWPVPMHRASNSARTADQPSGSCRRAPPGPTLDTGIRNGDWPHQRRPSPWLAAGPLRASCCTARTCTIGLEGFLDTGIAHRWPRFQTTETSTLKQNDKTAID
jgi:hypothetical protein